MTIAVNVSSMEVRAKDFTAGVFEILEETGLDPAALELELTESVLMRHADSAASILQVLRERGVHVAVDDFGTGYSSLSYPRRFRIDAPTSIDQSFVSRSPPRRRRHEHRHGGHQHGPQPQARRAIAEGGRDPRAAGVPVGISDCDEAQGYYFSRPAGRTVREAPQERESPDPTVLEPAPAADCLGRTPGPVDASGERVEHLGELGRAAQNGEWPPPEPDGIDAETFAPRAGPSPDHRLDPHDTHRRALDIGPGREAAWSRPARGTTGTEPLPPTGPPPPGRS
jgi:EAL domain-containing protein (putative c-di-GMP-specific phosphodiesterase class I)